MNTVCLLSILCAACFLPSLQQEVEGPGQFTRTFVIGTTGNLTCTWTGLTNPNQITQVKWKLNNDRIKAGGKSRYTITSSGFYHSLIIDNIEKKDTGTYTCTPKFKKANKKAPDGTFFVSVVKATLPDTPSPRTLELYEGQGTNISCLHLVKDRYGLKTYWTVNDTKLKGDNDISEGSKTTYRMLTDTDGRDWLELTKMEMSTAGEYKCNYKYPDKQVFSMTFNIEVRKQPRREYAKNTTWMEDKIVGGLLCDLSSLEDSTVKRFYWEKDGEEITEDHHRYSISEAGSIKKLNVDNVDKEIDEGVYRCVAELEFTSISVKFNVMVEESKKDEHFTEWTSWSVLR